MNRIIGILFFKSHRLYVVGGVPYVLEDSNSSIQTLLQKPGETFVRIAQLCFSNIAPQKILCPTHVRILEIIPWADSNCQITYRLEFFYLIFCQMMSRKAAAKAFKLTKSTLSGILRRSIIAIRYGSKIRGLKSIGVDKISYCKCKEYATIVHYPYFSIMPK